jgi:hypothetical protein
MRLQGLLWILVCVLVACGTGPQVRRDSWPEEAAAYRTPES